MADKYISNVRATIESVQKKGRTTKAALKEGVFDAVHVAFERSQKYVPVEFGPLKASGEIVTIDADSDSPLYAIFYGGPTATYALPVHEIAGARHAPPTCYKYLERAVRETRNQQSYAIKRRLQIGVSGHMKPVGGGQSISEDINAFGDF
jgi:hypothetical protein